MENVVYVCGEGSVDGCGVWGLCENKEMVEVMWLVCPQILTEPPCSQPTVKLSYFLLGIRYTPMIQRGNKIQKKQKEPAIL